MLVVTGKRILIDSESEPAPYTILVKDEKIAEIRPGYRTGVSSNDEVIDACDYMVMPGVVDAHVLMAQHLPSTHVARCTLTNPVELSGRVLIRQRLRRLQEVSPL